MEAVTQASLLEALSKAFDRTGPDDAMTTYEIAREFGRSHDWASAKVRILLDLGKVERVAVMRTDMKGVTQPVPGYRLRT